MIERAEVRTAYLSAGLRLVSAIPLDEMCQTVEPGAPDVSIEIARPAVTDPIVASSTHVTVVGEPGAPWLQVRRYPEGYVARWPGSLDVIIPDGGRKILVNHIGGIDDSVARLLLCHVMSFVLPWHGREGFHASAVEIDGKGVVLAGLSGRGKSTLATALCRAGGRLLADDLSSIRSDGGRIVVDSSTNRTWLWREVAEQISTNGNEITDRPHKVTVSSERFTESVPIVGVYLLGFGSDAPTFGEALTGADAAAMLIAQSFNLAMRSPRRLALQFALTTDLARQAPIVPLGWEPSPDSAAAVADHIIAITKGTDSPSLPGGPMKIPTNNADSTATDRKKLLEVLGAHGVEADIDDSFSEPLLRTSQVASLLRTTDRTVRTWAEAGKLTYIRTLGGRRLFPASGVVAVLETMRAHTRQEG